MNWQFVSKIYKHRKQPYLDVPLEISEAMRVAADNDGFLTVSGTINEIPIQMLLIPRLGQRYRLFVNGDIRQRTHVDVGDFVNVSLELDIASREPEVPDDLAEALSKNDEVRAAFEKLTIAKRNEMIKWLLTQTQKDEPRLKRLEHLCAYLATGQM